uniref:Uncharacterized protein n=1 Tax=Anguilla anguilla TaxID=7936 RepID=A0A0E9VR51_ANGAN
MSSEVRETLSVLLHIGSAHTEQKVAILSKNLYQKTTVEQSVAWSNDKS